MRLDLTLRQAWNGSWSSLPLMTMLGKSNKCTSSGSNIPFLVTMICLGCSSTGSDLINAATSSAVFHFANYKYYIRVDLDISLMKMFLAFKGLNYLSNNKSFQREPSSLLLDVY